jgi:hypothetical protein
MIYINWYFPFKQLQNMFVPYDSNNPITFTLISNQILHSNDIILHLRQKNMWILGKKRLNPSFFVYT